MRSFAPAVIAVTVCACGGPQVEPDVSHALDGAIAQSPARSPDAATAVDVRDASSISGHVRHTGPLFVLGHPAWLDADAGYCDEFAGGVDTCDGKNAVRCGPQLPYCTRFPYNGPGPRPAEPTWACCADTTVSPGVACSWPQEVGKRDGGCPCLGCE
jgi:hypothetical protein